jgi:membrane protein DedA with SNARE-associated domain
VTFSLIGTVVAIITTVMRTVGLPGLFALMAVESFGVPPLPSEVILPFAGFLVATGDLPLAPTVAVALAGGLVGAYAAYAVGRWWRHRITGLGVGPIRLRESHLEQMDRWFREHGEATVALARCVPVVRAYISYPAGTAKMDARYFGIYTLLGSVPFTLALVFAGIELGHHWGAVEYTFRYLDLAIYAVLIAAGAYFLTVYLVHRYGARAPSVDGPPPPPPPP